MEFNRLFIVQHSSTFLNMMASQNISLFARLPLQVLILGLIFGLGLLPERCAGLRCYDCVACNIYTESYTGNKSELERWPQNDCASGSCFNITSEGRVIQLGCVDGLTTECLKRANIGMGCLTLNDDNFDQFEDCVNVKVDSRNAGPQPLDSQLCFCDTELCNEFAGSGAAPEKIASLRAVILVGIGSFCLGKRFFRA